MADIFEYNPPPWEVRVCRDVRHNVNSYDVCLQAESDATGVGVVASVYAGEQLARLIAAAPELYEELEHFVDIIDGTEEAGFDPSVEQMLMDAAEVARKLLAKARGEQS